MRRVYRRIRRVCRDSPTETGDVCERTSNCEVFRDGGAVAAMLLRGSRGVKLALALRTVRAVAVPGHAKGFGTGRTICQPARAAFGTFVEQGLGATERLASLLQVNDETARSITTYEEGLHMAGLLNGGGCCIRRWVYVNTVNYARSITECFGVGRGCLPGAMAE